MFRALSSSHRLISMPMPFVFLMAWMACIAACTEYPADYIEQNSELVAAGEIEVQSIETSHCSEDCFLTSPAAFQERQNVNAPALLAQSVSLPPLQNLVSAGSVPASDINQNSPPAGESPPLYLLLCNFRI